MLFPRHWFWFCLRWLWAGGGFWAPTHVKGVISPRRKRLSRGMWSRAEVEFAQFAGKYPESGRVAEALLMQSEADLKQGKFLQAVALLIAREPQAGDLTDQYVYWLGEAQFQNADYVAAAGTFFTTRPRVSKFKLAAGRGGE